LSLKELSPLDILVVGITNIGSLLSSGNPNTNTSEIILPICLGGKFVTAATCFPMSSAGR